MEQDNAARDEPEPEPDFSGIRAVDVPPEATITVGIRDGLAQIDESYPNSLMKVIALVYGEIPLALNGVMELELQLIKLRQELCELRGY